MAVKNRKQFVKEVNEQYDLAGLDLRETTHKIDGKKTRCWIGAKLKVKESNGKIVPLDFGVVKPLEPAPEESIPDHELGKTLPPSEPIMPD